MTRSYRSLVPGEMPFTTRLATSESDLLGAQRLRYRVFVEELGGDGDLVDHAGRFERDAFDPYYDHMVLIDPRRDEATLDHVIGVYRLLPGDRRARMGRFYCESEYDLSPLEASGRKLLELGRSCVEPANRGGAALFQLWQGLGAYVTERQIEVLFGVASFHGTDIDALRAPLSLLHHRHLAPEELRVRAIGDGAVALDLMPEAEIDRPAAMRTVPALIKSYLRLGGCIGEGAYVDRAFNTTDICLVMDVSHIGEKQRSVYAGAPAGRPA